MLQPRIRHDFRDQPPNRRPPRCPLHPPRHRGRPIRKPRKWHWPTCCQCVFEERIRHKCLSSRRSSYLQRAQPQWKHHQRLCEVQSSYYLATRSVQVAGYVGCCFAVRSHDQGIYRLGSYYCWCRGSGIPETKYVFFFFPLDLTITNRIPAAAQVSKLRSLITENIDITGAEIAAWQQAWFRFLPFLSLLLFCWIQSIGVGSVQGLPRAGFFEDRSAFLGDLQRI